jgi:DNA polymerase III subunit epsilon
MIEVILDTETTGLSAEKNRIVEIACVELNNHIPDKKYFPHFFKS